MTATIKVFRVGAKSFRHVMNTRDDSVELHDENGVILLVYGPDAKVNNQDGETHYEYGVGASYAIQNGPLKDTAIRATYVTHRASKQQSDGNLNEFRLVTTIPFNIL